MSDATNTPSSQTGDPSARIPAAAETSAGFDASRPPPPQPESTAQPPGDDGIPAQSTDSAGTALAESDTPTIRPARFAGLVRGDQLVVGVLVLAAVVLLTIHWIRLSGWGLRPIEIDRLSEHRYDYRIDVNSATWVEWVQLDGIGETLAQRIIDDRDRNGPFERIEDLTRVKGLGPKTIAKLRPWLTVRHRDGAPAASLDAESQH